jgi:hypothetical protein
MGARDSARASLRAGLTAVPVLQAQYWLPCKKVISSEKSDGDLRPIAVDFRQLMSSTDGVAIDCGPPEAAGTLRQRKLKPYFSQGRVVKGGSLKRATALLMSQEMAS